MHIEIIISETKHFEKMSSICRRKQYEKEGVLMKFGFRKPLIKRSISARTTGQAKRAIKRALIPGYGKRDMGILHSKKALYNHVYRRTTFGLGDILKALFK